MTRTELYVAITQYARSILNYANVSDDLVSWPNAVKDHSSDDLYFKVHIDFYTPINVTLSKTQLVSGFLNISIFDKIGDGLGAQVDYLKLFEQYAELNNLIALKVDLDKPEIKMLDHTLSRTQTTTDIPKSQTNFIINFYKVI